jgi:uncharacterized protein
MYVRKQKFDQAEDNSIFFWGARQTGKSTLLKTLFPQAFYIDLLLNDVFLRFLEKPSQFRETILGLDPKTIIIVDEVQKLPQLLDEVHWLIVNHKYQFILSGSSPRKILRSGTNLLGGRAFRYELYPLTTDEIPDFDLLRALNNGMLPRHYDAKNPSRYLASYIGAYLDDEIVSESRIKRVDLFSKFLTKAAFSNGQMVSYNNIAQDCGVSAPTVREYFKILEDSMIGRFVDAFQKKPKRRIISSPKFYFFDVGLANHLLKRQNIDYGSINFGEAFEHFIYMELYAHSHYSSKDYSISYWRTASGFEVDFILGDHEVAIEVKGTENVQSKHLKGLKAFSEDYIVPKKIVVSNDLFIRIVDDITVMPWKIFLSKLWAGEII